MEPLRRTALAKRSTAAAGIAAALLVGALFPAVSRGTAEAGVTTKAASGAVSASAEMGDNEMVEFIEYRKAGIDEYSLAAVTSVPEAEPSEEVKPEETEVKEEGEKISLSDIQGDSAEPYVYRADFAIELPADGTKVYDPQPEKLNYTKTRSIAKEYYTVNDLITGRKITMNAYDLVCGMVYNEIGANWNVEAIKAQAVAAYSHLRFNDAMGFVPTVAVKTGYPAKIKNCVSAVEGQCVYYNGGIANTVYAASTAGYSCDSAKVFGVSYAYLKPVVGAYDSQDPNYGTTTKFTESFIRKKLEARLGFKLSNDVKNWFKVASVFSGKYVDTLVIDGGKAKMSGQAARTLFGLKSAAFEISYSNGFFTFKTYGYGHGVGMSQWGMKLYADHGYSYDQILRHYYVNTAIKVSDASVKALKRGNMSDAELQKLIKESTVAAPESSGANPVNDITVDKDAVKKAEAAEKAAEASQTSAAETPAQSTQEPAPASENGSQSVSEGTEAQTPAEEEPAEEPAA